MGEFLVSVIGIGVGTLVYDTYISKEKTKDAVERAIFTGVFTTLAMSILK